MPRAPLLVLDQVSKRFGAVVVADRTSLIVGRGEAVGVIGPNGAGKTSLFNIIAGTIRADSGKISLAERDITDLPAAARCTMGLARTFQVPRPFTGMSVFENVLAAASFGAGLHGGEADRHCLAVLDQCGLIDKANRRAGSLPLLDRKRLELARALASRPSLLLLDEVGGGLTEHECVELVNLVRAIHAGGVAIVWIEHIVHALLAAVERLIVINAGVMIADGNPQTIIKSRDVAELYMGLGADA